MMVGNADKRRYLLEKKLISNQYLLKKQLVYRLIAKYVANSYENLEKILFPYSLFLYYRKFYISCRYCLFAIITRLSIVSLIATKYP